MQSRSYESWIFGFADDVDAWPVFPYDLLRLGLSTFYGQSLYNAKTLSLSAVEAAAYT